MFLESLALATVLYGAAPDKVVAPQPTAKAKAKVDENAEIDGFYSCKGKEAGGKSYSGVCVIAKKGDIYLVSWMIGAGSTFSGVGIRQGNSLSVSWAMAGDRGLVRGVNVYTIQSNRLVGRWATLPGPGLVQTETLTFLKGAEDDD